MATVVEGYPKAHFSIATTLRCRGGRYSFPWIAPLYPWSLPFGWTGSSCQSYICKVFENFESHNIVFSPPCGPIRAYQTGSSHPQIHTCNRLLQILPPVGSVDFICFGCIAPIQWHLFNHNLYKVFFTSLAPKSYHQSTRITELGVVSFCFNQFTEGNFYPIFFGKSCLHLSHTYTKKEEKRKEK